MEQQLGILYPAISSAVIALVVSNCEDYVLDYCRLDEIPSALESVVFQMSKEDLNKIGAEGFNSESAGGASVSYETDYSPLVYKRLNKHKRMLMI